MLERRLIIDITTISSIRLNPSDLDFLIIFKLYNTFYRRATIYLMKITEQNIKTIIFIQLAFLLTVVGSLSAYGEYRHRQLIKQIIINEDNYASTTNELVKKINTIDAGLTAITDQNVDLRNVVKLTQDKSNSFEEIVGQVNNTALTLDKLSKTDPQLLQKYSKVFFLNEHYIPSKLASIPSQYTFNKSTTYQIHAEVAPHILSMIKAAAQDNATLQVISAYRSFGTQAALKSSYKVTYGAGTANSFSADQGYSEHQLGTTLDFTTPAVGDTFDNFDGTLEYKWLQSNAHLYGFILSYPQTNTYYQYEPWHWRYVGIDLATRLHRDGKNFYDVDQRFINDYLSVIFD